jgi:prepilin-type processing-associated H-X9-DG protein
MLRSSTRAGLTLVEVCVVIFVIVLLLGLLIPSVGSRRPARRLQCTNNQRQISDAMVLYDSTFGFTPPSLSTPIDPTTRKPARMPLSWVSTLCAQLGRADLIPVTFTFTAANAPNIPLVVCPAEPSKNGTGGGPLSYVVNGGGFKHWKADGSITCLDRGVWELRVDQPQQVTPKKNLAYIALIKGLAQAISHGENLDARSYIPTSAQADYEVTILWDPSAPLGFNQDVGGQLDDAHARPSSNHPGGAVVTFCDGHVSFIGNSIDYKVYATLMAVDPLSATSPTKPLPQSDPLSKFLVWPVNQAMIPTK